MADYAAVERAVKNQDAVICALGSTSPLRRDPTLIEGLRNIIDAMEQAGIRRLIYLSFLGVRNGRNQLSFLGRYIVALVLRPLLLASNCWVAQVCLRRPLWVISGH